MNCKETIFDNLERLSEAVVALFGRHCEVCVHDLGRLPHSLVSIRGEVTGRRPGAPATDLLMKILQQGGGKGRDRHCYRTTTADGRTLKSSTTLIRNDEGEAVAAFCINFDTTELYNAGQALQPFIEVAAQTSDNGETFAHSLDETFSSLFEEAVHVIGRHPATMNVEEKTRLVAELAESGTFRLKGAVEQVAEMMGVTKFTIYNYLKKIRSSDQLNSQEK